MELSSMVEYQKSVESIVTRVVRQWLMPLSGLNRGNNEDKWLNEAIVNFLKIINIDHVRHPVVFTHCHFKIFVSLKDQTCVEIRSQISIGHDSTGYVL